MKKLSRHLAPLAAAAGALACASAAQAQQASSVQLYGLLDTGVEYVSNVGGSYSLTRVPPTPTQPHHAWVFVAMKTWAMV